MSTKKLSFLDSSFFNTLYIFINIKETLKKMTKLHASTIVVIIGEAIYAGSSFKVFRKDDHTDYKRIADNRELFYDKSVYQINNAMKEQGYETTIRKSRHTGSKAKFIIVGNSNKNRNVTTVEVTPGTPRHGNVPYVRISTSDLGKFKVINGTKEQYKTDNCEKAKLIFRRKSK